MGRTRSLRCRRLRNHRQRSLGMGVVRLGEILVGKRIRGLVGVDLDLDQRVEVEVEGLDKDSSSRRKKRSRLVVVGGRRRIRSRCWLIGVKG